MTSEASTRSQLSAEDRKLLQRLRSRGPARHAHAKQPATRAQVIADKVAATVGSWRFIIIQSSILAIWIILNLVGFIEHWDPYPFILLNLVLSFQAAYTAPIIMMSQNRQAEIDRRNAEHDYDVNVKAELEIELLHHKIDAMREQEILKLVAIIERLENRVAGEAPGGTARPSP